MEEATRARGTAKRVVIFDRLQAGSSTDWIENQASNSLYNHIFFVYN